MSDKIGYETLKLCCNTCPMLVDNLEKSNPDYYHEPDNPNPNHDYFLNWFSKSNINRLIKGIRQTGELIICHSNHKDGAEYGGINAKTNKVCLGSTIAIYHEIRAYEDVFLKYPNWSAKDIHKEYRKGRANPISLRVLHKFAMMIQLGITDIPKGLPLPLNHDEVRQVHCLSQKNLK